MYKLKLIKGLSYSNGSIKATKDNPFCIVDDKEAADIAVSSGYFKLLEAETEGVQLSELDSVELDKMNATELKAIAKANDIDLTGCKTNADRIERIGNFFMSNEEGELSFEEGAEQTI